MRSGAPCSQRSFLPLQTPAQGRSVTLTKERARNKKPSPRNKDRTSSQEQSQSGAAVLKSADHRCSKKSRMRVPINVLLQGTKRERARPTEVTRPRFLSQVCGSVTQTENTFRVVRKFKKKSGAEANLDKCGALASLGKPQVFSLLAKTRRS